MTLLRLWYEGWIKSSKSKGGIWRFWDGEILGFSEEGMVHAEAQGTQGKPSVWPATPREIPAEKDYRTLNGASQGTINRSTTAGGIKKLNLLG